MLPLAAEVWGWAEDEEPEPPQRPEPPGRVYGLCFRNPDGSKGYLHHAGHYIGVALDGDVQRRVGEHLTGRGSPLVAAAVEAGLEIRLVLIIPGDRKLERRLHNQQATTRSNGHGLKRGWCPACEHAARLQPRLPLEVPGCRRPTRPAAAAVTAIDRLTRINSMSLSA